MRQLFVADDHIIVCEGLRAWVESLMVFEWAGSARDADGVLSAAAKQLWDVLVLDLSLLGTPSVELLRRVKQLQPALRVVIYSMYPASEYEQWALASGASAYVSKSQPLDALRAALEQTESHDTLATEAADSRLAHERLAPRELSVFLAIARGRTPSEIAGDFEMAPSTVSTHLKGIRKKLGVNSTLEVAQYAARHGITGNVSP